MFLSKYVYLERMLPAFWLSCSHSTILNALFTMHPGKRKPDPDFYLAVVEHLKVDPASCIFIDDRYHPAYFSLGRHL